MHPFLCFPFFFFFLFFLGSFPSSGRKLHIITTDPYQDLPGLLLFPSCCLKGSDRHFCTHINILHIIWGSNACSESLHPFVLAFLTTRICLFYADLASQHPVQSHLLCLVQPSHTCDLVSINMSTNPRDGCESSALVYPNIA